MKSKSSTSILRKGISAILTVLLVMGICVVPYGVSAEEPQYQYQNTYSFSEEEGIQYGNALVSDMSGVEHQISRAQFAHKEEDGEDFLRIWNLSKSENAVYDAFLFNDANGLFELMPSTEYTVSFRVKINSPHVTFEKNGATYPSNGQTSKLKLVYGLPKTLSDSETVADKTIGLIAKVSAVKNDFIAEQDGVQNVFKVGEWLTLTYNFTTPASFGKNGNALGLTLESYNGLEILIDEINVGKTCYITVDAKEGTISKTKFAHRIGDKINIENPTYKFGYDFAGWYIDSARTIKFTDEYVTRENCELTLYAGYSDMVFGFEAYQPSHATYSFATPFLSVVETADAVSGKNVAEYCYTPETYNKLYHEGYTDGSESPWYKRRTQDDNNISIKNIEPNSSYIVTFKCKIPTGMGNCKAYIMTSNESLWGGGCRKAYEETETIIKPLSGDWQEVRMVFTTGELKGNNSRAANTLFLIFHASAHKETIAYIDDINVVKVGGEMTTTINANGGQFKDGSTEKKQSINFGDSIYGLEHPVKEGFDFTGWFIQSTCTTPANEYANSDICLNTVYAGWTKGMGFESYYYDLNDENSHKYFSSNASIVSDNVYSGSNTLKIVNKASSDSNVVALNPINDSQRYLISFNYKVESAASDISIGFATMNMDKDNAEDFVLYPNTYTVKTDEAGKGYHVGALVIETDIANGDADRLALVVKSSNASDYTIYVDEISVDILEEGKGFALVNDGVFKNSVKIGTIGETVKFEQPKKSATKFLGFYTDEAKTTIYAENYTYSESGSTIYTKWAIGEGFEGYTDNVANVVLTQDSNNIENKYLTLSGNATINLGNVEPGKKYGVDFRYSIDAKVTENVEFVISNNSQTKATTLAGAGWLTNTFVVVPDTSALSLTVNTTGTVLIDDVVIYEITGNIGVIYFNEKDDRGYDSVSAGAVGTAINYPEKFSYSDETFVGWCSDSAVVTPFISNTFTKNGEMTLYARWITNPDRGYNFDDIGDVTTALQSNGAPSKVSGSTSASNTGKNSVVMVKEIFNGTSLYFPLLNKDGLCTLEKNTTYTLSFCYHYIGSEDRKVGIVASGTTYNSSSSKKYASITVEPQSSWRKYTVTFTTDSSSNNVLYITNDESGINWVTRKEYEMYIDTVSIHRVDANVNYTYIFDSTANKNYEYVGHYGAEIEAPPASNIYNKIDGVYADAEYTTKAALVHQSESLTQLYLRQVMAKQEFENYEYANSSSRYARGDDVNVTDDDSFETLHSLKYEYSYSPSYETSTKNVAALGYVSDNTTYKITFRYKMKESQSDVDIKFRTAHKSNYFGLFTEYPEAEYRIYHNKVGTGWNKAEVYLTTKFVSAGTSALFMSFNPVVEGETVVFIDSIDVESLESNKSVAAFLDQNGKAGQYVVVNKGSAVTMPSAPESQFASLAGWYTDEECTVAYKGAALSNSGVTKIYSKWNNYSEKFENYAYATKNTKAQSASAIKDNQMVYTSTGEKGYFRLGKIEDNTSYKLTFHYKSTTPGITVGFVTASENDINVNRTDYIDDGNVRYIAGNADGSHRTGILYFTSSFTYTVPNDKNANLKENENAVYGDMLYITIEGAEGVSIAFTDFTVEKIDVLNEAGVQILTKEASDTVGGQAMRFCFGYKATDILKISVGSDTLTLVERGIIFKNAKNTVTGIKTEDGITVKPVTVYNADSRGHIKVSKTYGFNQYWSYDNKTGETIYSAYISDFAVGDERLMSARGYLKLKDQWGNLYTLYSSDRKTNVKESEDVNSEITKVDVHTISNKPWSAYTIIHPKTMSYIYGQEIENLIAYAKDTHGVTLNRATEKATITNNEIIIGDAKRDEAKGITISDENKYIITVIGNKLVIKGGSDLATMQGVKDFIEYLKMKDGLGCGADLYDGFTIEGYVKDTSDNYKLTFNDDFNASQMDVSVWQEHSGRKMGAWNGRDSLLGGKTDFRNPGDPGYTTYLGRVVENGIFTRNGSAVLTAARINEGKDGVVTEGGINNIASEMSTMRTMSFKYGMWEIKAKLSAPVSYTGFWTVGANNASRFDIRDTQGYRTEIDLIENFGENNYFVPNIHYWWDKFNSEDTGHSSLDSSSYNNRKYNYTPDADETSLYDDYHTFTYLWTKDGAVFAFDGIKYFEYKDLPHNQNVTTDYLIISQCLCAVGMGEDAWEKATDEQRAVDYYETLLDYVRIYQIEDMGSEMNR